MLDVNLNALPRILYLLVRFRDILWILHLAGHFSALRRMRYRPVMVRIYPRLAQFHPEYDESGMRISFSHVMNQLELFLMYTDSDDFQVYVRNLAEILA